MKGIVILIPAILVILATVWALWLIFRKGDMVTQPTKVVMYFAGALVALVIAGCLMVVIFPAWIIQIWDYANVSPNVQTLQQRTEELFDQSLGQPTVAPRPTPIGATPPVSPLPGPGGSGALSTTPPPGYSTYIVQQGDTLFSISRKHNNVPVQSIRTANGLTSDIIKPGQVLIIPKQ